jgi:hypothetical protein
VRQRKQAFLPRFLPAVFASNFSGLPYAIADEISEIVTTVKSRRPPVHERYR